MFPYRNALEEDKCVSRLNRSCSFVHSCTTAFTVSGWVLNCRTSMQLNIVRCIMDLYACRFPNGTSVMSILRVSANMHHWKKGTADRRRLGRPQA